MAADDFKTYACSYYFDGCRWGFTVKARSFDEAERRIRAMIWASVDGEVRAVIPVPGPLARLWMRLSGARPL